MRLQYGFLETIEVKQNLIITGRERGKIVIRREGHNIWLNLGREWLAKLITYTSFSPVTPEIDDRIRYMGFGIGGTRQVAPGVANAAPLVTAYPGSNVQTDDDPTVTRLERPVRVAGSTTTYPGSFGDQWLGQVQAPSQHPLPTQTKFRRLFSSLEVNYEPYVSVPLSEVGLFTAAANPLLYNNTAIAYDTFDTISKTRALELEIAWTIIF
jgi:hypothetical protein